MSTTRYVVDNGQVRQEIPVGDEWQEANAQPSTEVWKHLRTTLDTGIMPPGVRLFRQAGTEAQVVMEFPPAINRLLWSEYEGSACTTYLVAQPWRIVVAAYNNEQLVGARMFYRPNQLCTLNDTLFHANLPNINCSGYGANNGVGWVCLYGKAARGKTWGEWFMQLADRCSGLESYNNHNMGETDGPNLYRQFAKPAWMSDPVLWEQKTEAEGLALLDDAEWIPVLVGGKDDQARHKPGGKPLSVKQVLEGSSDFTYNDARPIKLPATLARGDEIPNLTFTEAMQQAFSRVANDNLRRS